MPLIKNIMRVGECGKLPYYSVCGNATCMYVWINENGIGSNTEWIKGHEAFDLWHKFSKMEKKDKEGFISLAKRVFKQHAKPHKG